MASTPSDPPPSWNRGPAKDAIVAFIAKVYDAESPDVLPVAKRVAVVDTANRYRKRCAT